MYRLEDFLTLTNRHEHSLIMKKGFMITFLNILKKEGEWYGILPKRGLMCEPSTAN
jgi:hypothetical protein